MDVGQWFAIGLSVAIGVWFVAGYLINRRRAEAVYHWLQAGLGQFGELSEMERAGRPANAFRMAVGRPVDPFERVEAVFILEPRENPPLWLYSHLQGQRDELILRFTLRPHPDLDIEAAQAVNPEFRKLVTAGQKPPYQLLPAPHGFEIASQDRLEPATAERWRALLDTYANAITRLAVHRKKPHLFLRARLSALLPRPPAKVLADFRSLVD
jgi:hypothetical protein